MSCFITKSGLKKSLTAKGLAVAQGLNSKFKVSAIGEILLLTNSKIPSISTAGLARKAVNKAVTQINKELNIDPKKFGVVFGGVTYSDGAAIQVVVTPAIFNAYLVKNKEATYQEIFERPLEFYKGDIALQSQEARDLSQLKADFEALEQLATEENLNTAPPSVIENIKPTLIPTLKPSTSVDLSVDFKTKTKNNLDDLGFEEVRCES